MKTNLYRIHGFYRKPCDLRKFFTPFGAYDFFKKTKNLTRGNFEVSTSDDGTLYDFDELDRYYIVKCLGHCDVFRTNDNEYIVAFSYDYNQVRGKRKECDDYFICVYKRVNY